MPEEQRSVSVSPTSAAAAEVADTDFLDHTERVYPTWAEPLVRHASTPIGGPLGRHASVGRHWFWSPLRVALAFALLALVFSWFGKASCIQQYTDENGVTQLDWRAERPYVAMCYSDVVPLYTAEQLDKPGGFPYKSSWVDDAGKPTAHVRYMEYPVLTGMFQWINAKLAQGWTHFADLGWLPTGLTVAVYFDITAFWLALAWLVTVWAVARTARRRPWDAILVAVSPLVLVHAFTNFDTLATAFAATGMLAWARRKPVLAGVLFGLGVAAKLYPVFLVGALLVLCLRAGKLKQWAITAGAMVVTWVAVNFRIYQLFPEGWYEFFRRNTSRGADPDSLYNVFSYFTGWTGFDGDLAPNQVPSVLNAVSLVLFLLCCAGIAWIGLAAERRPRFAQLAFLVVAAFLLTNKVWSPQYSLWLVPLAVLAVPRWKPLLAWMTLDALVWVPRMMFYLGTDHKGLPQDWFLGAVVLRDLAVLGLCALVIREIYRPRHDLVRQRGDDDPSGGVLEDAPDVFRLGRRRPIADQAATTGK